MGERRPSLSHAYVPLLTLLLLVLIAQPIDARSKKPKPYVPPVGYDKIKHTVVIFLEGWSFESLLPAWPGVDRLANATQSSMEGFKFRVLPAPLLAPVNGTRSPDLRFPADAPVAGFDLSLYYPPTAPTPPLVQRFWQEQYQINAGKMDKFVAWGGAGGLPLGYANSSTMPLTAMAAKEGAILANVHHSIYGGGFANLMYLTCGSILKWPSAPVSELQRFSQVTENELLDDAAVTPSGYVVNDVYPSNPPLPTPMPSALLPLQTMRTIGENLTDANVTWAWYSGGWDAAMAGNADATFEYSQQPFAFFANFSVSSQMRAHLQDEADFFDAARNGSLPEVSFVKPLGKYSGAYAIQDAEQHAADLIDALKENEDTWAGTLVVVLFTDNGGRYDSHAPPARDEWGPGTRVPAFLLGPLVKHPFVDTRPYETASLLKLFHDRYGFALPKNISSLDGFTNSLNLDPHARPGFPWWGIAFVLVAPFIAMATCLGVVWYLQHIAHAPTGWAEQVDQQPQ